MTPIKTKAPATKALTKWDARLAEIAKSSKKAVATVGTGANFLSLKGGILSYQKAAIPGNTMNCVIVDYTLENQYYEGRYDESNIQAPKCYAFGMDKDTMAPNPENVEEPVHETCNGCPNNQWGSADTGKGKACAEVARLALITESDLEDIKGAEIAYLKVPVTSMAHWAGYVRQLDDIYSKPPLTFITTVSIVKQEKQPGWHLAFQIESPVEDPETFEALMEKYEIVNKSIAFPYPKFEAEAKPRGKAAPPPKKRKY